MCMGCRDAECYDEASDNHSQQTAVPPDSSTTYAVDAEHPGWHAYTVPPYHCIRVEIHHDSRPLNARLGTPGGLVSEAQHLEGNSQYVDGPSGGIGPEQHLLLEIENPRNTCVRYTLNTDMFDCEG